MRIVVNDFAASSGGGISILRQLYRYIVESNDDNEWYFLLSQEFINETANIHVIVFPKSETSRKARLKFDFFDGRRFFRDLCPDVILYLQNTLVLGVDVPQVMYMDQAIAFQTEKNFSFLNTQERPYAIYQYLIGFFNRVACRKSNYTIVQTEWLKKAIVNRCKIPWDKVIKVYPNISPECYKYHAKDIKENVFFYPASGAIYKNHTCLYKAVDLLSQECTVELTLTECDTKSNKFVCIGSIEQNSVYERMSKSVLVFPSYIESYGLPLKEARIIGTVILAADTSFAREILDGYENAYFFNPFDPYELADLMKRVIEGRIQHQEQDTLQAPKEDSWKKIVSVLEETVKTNKIWSPNRA